MAGRRGLALVGLAAWAAIAWPAPHAAASPGAVAVEVAEAAGAFEVHGRFRVRAAPAVAWRVLTDYDGLGRFVPAMRSRLVARSGPDAAIVAQETTVAFLGLQRTQRVVLRLQESPPSQLSFQDLAHDDFEVYRGAWHVQAGADDIEVRYEAVARPVWAPPLVGAPVLTRTVASLLDALRREIERRAR